MLGLKSGVRRSLNKICRGRRVPAFPLDLTTIDWIMRRMTCDVGKATEGLKNEQSLILQHLSSLDLRHSSLSNHSVASPTSQLVIQPFRRFTYVTARYPTLSSLHLRHSSLSNPSVASPTSQLVIQPFRRFTYVTARYPTLSSLHLRHSSFYNLSVASFTSHALHLRHLASRPCYFVTLPSVMMFH